MTAWAEVAWREDAVGEALIALARCTGLQPRAVATPRVPLAAIDKDDRAFDRFLESAAEYVGVEAEPIECTYGELPQTLRSVSPALVRVQAEGKRGYVAVVRSNRRAVVAVTPLLSRVRIDIEELRRVLTDDMEKELSKRVNRWLSIGRVTGRRAERARRELLEHFLSEDRVGGMWLLRPDPGSSFLHQLRLKRIGKRALVFAAASLVQVAANMASWAMIGEGALNGFFEPGWLAAWALMSLSAIPLQLMTTWSGGHLTMAVSALLKQRLLAGALRVEADEVRAQGSGSLLAMVSESEAIEAAGLAGALGAIVALIQLIGAAAVLFLGAGGALHTALLVGWCVIVAGVARRLYRSRAKWTMERFALTNSFVENVVGNRTRITQQPAVSWHRDEDDQLDAYLVSSRTMDSHQRFINALPARGWLLIGFVGLVPPVLAGRADATSLAISIGGILQAQTAIAALVATATALVSAHVAWRSVGHLFRAASAIPPPGTPDALAARSPGSTRPESTIEDTSVVLDVRGVSFRYHPTGEPAVRDAAMELRDGERVLLEGPSGGGKSTFASLLVGLRSPDTGHILLRGLDRATLGTIGWRQRIASAPQFHENHILSASLAFNLLMGRGWPASEDDRREATEVCRELGLGGLLDRMPAGLNQVVGETGWQLSHGERSRVFLARAMLQRSDVVVLDETFGALDPLTLKQCLEAVHKRANVVIAIAHP